MLKKFLSAMMAGGMILSLAVPAFAAETWGDANTGESDTEIETQGALLTPTLRVAVGSGAALAYNPTQMQYTPSMTAGRESVTAETQAQIISNETSVINLSNVPVKMFAKAVGVATNIADLDLTTDRINDDEENKRVLLFVEFVSDNDKAKLDGNDDSRDYTDYYVNQSSVSSNEDIQARQGWDGRKNQVQVKKEADNDWDNNDRAVMIFAANDITKTDASQINALTGTSSVGDGATGRFKFFGAMTKNPKTPWNGDDQITVKLTMKFSIMNNEVSST